MWEMIRLLNPTKFNEVKRHEEKGSLLTVLKNANASKTDNARGSLLKVLRERTRHRKSADKRNALLKFVRPEPEKK